MLALLFWPPLADAKDYIVKEPPASLNKLYPPESQESKWVGQMHKLSTNFGGVFVNMKEDDWENAEKRAAAFLEAYEESAKMVPEWKDYFDLDAAKNFTETVKSHDPAKIGKASGAVGKTCGKCHAEQYVAVWTRYHWPSVEEIKVTDPISEEEKKYEDYMGLLAGSFKGVTVNFGEKQYDRSLKALGIFKKRYMELKSTCSKCHTTDAVKQFYVGDNIASAFEAMNKELSSNEPNAGNFWKNVGIVGTQGCKMCHLTHRSYSIIQHVWEEK